MDVILYKSPSGRNFVLEFINTISPEGREDFFDAVMKLQKGEVLKMPLSRNLSRIYPGLHELRLRDNAGVFRVFYYIKHGDAIYPLHAFRKKTQEIPRREIELTLKRIKDLRSCLGKK